MKKLFSIFISLLILLFNFLYIAPNTTYAAPGCDLAFCTPSECSDSRCNQCDFCLICDTAFCTPSDCAQQRCWGCDFCTPDFCDVAFCTPADCGQRRCAACDFCTTPQNCACGISRNLICEAVTDNCPSGTTARCNSNQCDGSRNSCSCVATACSSAGGECRTIAHNICPDAYDPTPVGGFEELGCGSGEACCIPASSSCVTRNPITGCPGGTTRCPDAQMRCCPNVADCPVYDPGWSSPPSVPEVKVPIFCVGSDPSDTTTSPSSEKLATAIGCIPISGGQEFIAFILSWGIGIGGGIAFLLILYAGFMITTSSGDPKKLQAGRELLTAAIAGLLLLIFSVFILRLIGVNILGLPGFGG